MSIGPGRTKPSNIIQPIDIPMHSRLSSYTSLIAASRKECRDNLGGASPKGGLPPFSKKLCVWCNQEVNPADCWATVMGEDMWCDCGKKTPP